MATTSIIVELLIVGFFSLVWILLCAIRLSVLDVNWLRQSAVVIQSTPGMLCIVALSYQLGVIMNGISHKLMLWIGNPQCRKIDPDVSFDVVNMKVRQGASEEVNGILTLH